MMWEVQVDCCGMIMHDIVFWRKKSDDWVSACRSFEVNGVKDRGLG